MVIRLLLVVVAAVLSVYIRLAIADSAMIADSRGRIVGFSNAAKCNGGADPSPIFVVNGYGYYACIDTDVGTFSPIGATGRAIVEQRKCLRVCFF